MVVKCCTIITCKEEVEVQMVAVLEEEYEEDEEFEEVEEFEE